MAILVKGSWHWVCVQVLWVDESSRQKRWCYSALYVLI